MLKGMTIEVFTKGMSSDCLATTFLPRNESIIKIVVCIYYSQTKLLEKHHSISMYIHYNDKKNNLKTNLTTYSSIFIDGYIYLDSPRSYDDNVF